MPFCPLGKGIEAFKRPARYIDSEINARKKDWDSSRVRILFVYPDAYEIGMSSYGYHLLYHVMNRVDGVLCDRAFLPWTDVVKHMRERSIPLYGLETKRPAGDFHILAFSLHYELCYTNVLWCLSLSGLPLFRWDRRGLPVVVAGGPSTTNPAPLMPFIDAFFLGEWEAQIERVLESLVKEAASSGISREAVMAVFRDAEGILLSHEPEKTRFLRVKRLQDYPDPPLVPLIEVPHNRITVEIARGCSRGCRFCHAGFINRPVRERSVSEVLDIFERSLKATGFEEVSLLSLSATDHSCIKEIIKRLSKLLKDSMTSLSLPSFRAGTLTPDVIEAIKSVKKTGFTIAPEAGSQRLRDVINKNITDDEIKETVEKAVSAGWQTLKFYFMIGLPTETQEDIDAIVELIRELLKFTKRLPRKPRFNVTVSPFVPKPHTPFQWEAQEPIDVLWEKIRYIKSRIKTKKVSIKNHNPYQSLVEAFFSRADERGADVLLFAFERGAIFDEWSEHFRWQVWEEAFEKSGVDSSWLNSPWDEDKSLPWDVVDTGLKKDFLLEERRKAYGAVCTPDCRKSCSSCGVCGGGLRTVNAEDGVGASGTASPFLFKRERACKVLGYIRRLYPSSLVGQNDFEAFFHRALRRTGLPLSYSQGFHPHPLLSFAEALPVGIESEFEPFELSLWRRIDLKEMFRLNSFLGEGVKLLCVEYVDESFSIGKAFRDVVYFVKIDRREFPLVDDWRMRLENRGVDYHEQDAFLLFALKDVKPFRVLEDILLEPERKREVSVKRRVRILT